jgi:NADH-quinone oxidoreductase subunit D
MDSRVILENSKEMEDGLEEREMVLNMGPQHPSTHGVLRVILDLRGEVILRATPVLGYLHRGVEKIGENRRYNQFMPYTDRLDYVSGPSNNLAFAQAVEKLLGLEVPERAQYLRVILAEFARITSHLVWLGSHAMDCGAITMLLVTMRERELIMDIFEMSVGARLTTTAFAIGGMRDDVPDGFEAKVREFCKLFPKRIGEYDALLKANPIWINRTRDVGVISAEEAVRFGVTGPMLRGSGVALDLRKSQPYAVYDQLDFDVPTGQNGDCFDRYLVRVEEMRQSTRIIEQCLDKMPQGPIRAKAPKIVPPSKEAVMTSAAAMQQHFILMINGFEPPVGEVYSSIEGPKGELGFYIISDGSNQPYRLRVRPPSFINLQPLNQMIKGQMVSDIVATIGSIDIILGEVDR